MLTTHIATGHQAAAMMSRAPVANGRLPFTGTGDCTFVLATKPYSQRPTEDSPS